MRNFLRVITHTHTHCVCVCIYIGCKNFPKITNNFTCQIGDVKQVPYWGAINIRRYRIILVATATWHPGFVHPYIQTQFFILAVFASSPKRPHRLWGPSNLLSGYRRLLFSGGKVTGVWMWPVIPMKWWGQEWVELYLRFPAWLHGLHRNSCNFNDVFISKDDPTWTVSHAFKSAR
jgi:hypothetical protein